MKKWLELKDPLEYLNFVVVLQDGEGEKAIGIAGLGYIGNAFEKGYSEDKSKQYGVAGVIMNPDVRRLGYAYEALKISIDYGIRYLDMAQVTLGTSSKNVPMRRLMEEKFKIPAEVEEEDRFGNDLVWKIGREEWLGKLQD